MIKLLTEHHLEFLSLKGGSRGSSESTHVKMPHCWKSHALAHIKVTSIQGCHSILHFKFPDFTLLKADNDHSHPLTIGKFCTKYSCLLTYSFKKIKGIIEKKFFWIQIANIIFRSPFTNDFFGKLNSLTPHFFSKFPWQKMKFQDFSLTWKIFHDFFPWTWQPCVMWHLSVFRNF